MPKRPMRITHRFLPFRWFVGLLTDLFMRRGFSPLHKRIASAFSPGHDSPSNDRFSPRANFSARKTILQKYSYFRNSAIPFALYDSQAADGEKRFLPCPGFSPDSLVQRTRMRVRLLGSRICHKGHAIQFIYARLILRTQKDLSCPAISQAKEVSYSLYIRFDCTQKLPFYLNRKGWLVGWLVGWLQELCQLFTFL